MRVLGLFKKFGIIYFFRLPEATILQLQIVKIQNGLMLYTCGLLLADRILNGTLGVNAACRRFILAVLCNIRFQLL